MFFCLYSMRKREDHRSSRLKKARSRQQTDFGPSFKNAPKQTAPRIGLRKFTRLSKGSRDESPVSLIGRIARNFPKGQRANPLIRTAAIPGWHSRSYLYGSLFYWEPLAWIADNTLLFFHDLDSAIDKPSVCLWVGCRKSCEVYLWLSCFLLLLCFYEQRKKIFK